jgi:hypothetical protein
LILLHLPAHVPAAAPAARLPPFVKVLSKFRFWKNLFIFFTGKGLFFHEMSAIPSDS